MKKILLLALLPIMLLTLGAGVLGCQSSSNGPDAAAVRAYADPATDTMMQGLSQNDREKYIQDGDAAFKAAVTQEVFDAAATQINSQLGAYQSKEFVSVEEQESYIIVHYRATFEKGAVGLRMVFDSDHLVAGQFFE